MNAHYKVTPIDEVRYRTTVLQCSVEYVRQRRAYCFYRALWLLLWIYGALVTFGFVHSAVAILGMVTLLVLQLRQLVSFDAYFQRRLLERFGSSAIRELMVVIDDYGIAEHEADIVCFAPWAKVHDAGIHRDLLILWMESGRHIVIPRHSLEPREISLESMHEKVSTYINLSRSRIEKGS